MMQGWRDGRRVTPEALLQKTPSKWLKIYDNDLGLSLNLAKSFIDDAGLTFEYGQSYHSEGLNQLLKLHGPLWFTMGTSGGYNTHANLVVGLKWNTEGEIFVSYIDPANGTLNDEDYRSFMMRYERPAYLYNERFGEQMLRGEIVPLHVVHW